MSKLDYRMAQRVKPLGKAGVDAIRTILLERQYAKVNEVMVDTFTAGAIVGVYDRCNDRNKAALERLPVALAADICFKVLR